MGSYTEQDIITDYKANRPVEEICNGYHIAYKTVMKIILAAGLPRRPRGTLRFQEVSEEVRRRVLEDYQAGNAIQGTMDALGIGECLYSRIIKEAGAPKRHRGAVLSRKFTPEELLDITGKYAQGIDQESLGRLYRTHPRTIKKILQASGVELLGRGQKFPKDRKRVLVNGVEMFRCPKCQEAKPRGQFTTSSRAKHGVSSYCKPCHAIYLKGSFYGLTPVQYQELRDKQQNRCAICSSQGTLAKLSPLAVDHDHVTGKVRGLLCGRCNTMLGDGRDDPVILRKGADYLEEHHRTMV